MKFVMHHETTRVEIQKWEDKHTLLVRHWSTEELRTNLASDFGFCTLTEALTIVSVQLYSAWGGENELMVVPPGTKELIIGRDPMNFRELHPDKWNRECWQLQREIRDTRSGWHLNQKTDA